MSKPFINTTGQPVHQLELMFTNYVKNCFVTVVRQAFSHPFTPAEYRYSTLQAESQLGVYRAFPKKIAVKYPCILVETERGSTPISSLGEEQISELYDENNNVTDRVYSGVMNIPVKLTILAETTTDRERLTDLLSIYVRYVFRDLFYKFNMPYLDVQAGEDGEDVVDNKVIYKGFVTVRLQTQFSQKIDMTFYDLITSINLIPLFGSSRQDLQLNG